jgi:hypothetical protein
LFHFCISQAVCIAVWLSGFTINAVGRAYGVNRLSQFASTSLFFLVVSQNRGVKPDEKTCVFSINFIWELEGLPAWKTRKKNKLQLKSFIEGRRTRLFKLKCYRFGNQKVWQKLFWVKMTKKIKRQGITVITNWSSDFSAQMTWTLIH